MWYVLNPDKTVRPAVGNHTDGRPSAEEFAEIYNPETKIIGRDEIGNFMVSTVFLGLDHNYAPNGPPILFETMIFEEGEGEEHERYCTYQEAVDGHKTIVNRLLEEHSKKPVLEEPEFSLDEIVEGQKLVKGDR